MTHTGNRISRSRVLDKTEVIAESPAMRQALLMAHKMPYRQSRAVVGESGSGKEVLAKYPPAQYQIAEAFLAGNCATFPNIW
jgi:transcriptional regulator with PAS, ATPase and Fis domain